MFKAVLEKLNNSFINSVSMKPSQIQIITEISKKGLAPSPFAVGFDHAFFQDYNYHLSKSIMILLLSYENKQV